MNNIEEFKDEHKKAREELISSFAPQDTDRNQRFVKLIHLIHKHSWHWGFAEAHSVSGPENYEQEGE